MAFAAVGQRDIQFLSSRYSSSCYLDLHDLLQEVGVQGVEDHDTRYPVLKLGLERLLEVIHYPFFNWLF